MGALTLTASGSPSIEGRVMETGDGTVILDRVPIVTPSGDIVVPSLVGPYRNKKESSSSPQLYG